MVAEYVTKTHAVFVEAGGKDTTMRQFPNIYGKFDLLQYKDRWDLLKETRK